MRANIVMMSIVGMVIAGILSIPVMKYVYPETGGGKTPPAKLTTTVEEEVRTPE